MWDMEGGEGGHIHACEIESSNVVSKRNPQPRVVDLGNVTASDGLLPTGDGGKAGLVFVERHKKRVLPRNYRRDAIGFGGCLLQRHLQCGSALFADPW